MRIVCVVGCLSLLVTLPAAEEQRGEGVQLSGAHTRRVTWQDVAPFHRALETRGFSADSFPTRVEALADDNVRRVRLGDLDHLVFYLLQSTRFTSRPPIEPALSARGLVEDLHGPARDAFFESPTSARARVSDDVQTRVGALLRALEAPGDDRRLRYFARLVADVSPGRAARARFLTDEYLRVMRFVYEKEFGAGRSNAAAAASLYRTRGLSTDTAVESGFLVAQGLGVLRALEPERRVRRVLIVGAGLDLAPRTSLLEAAPPQSYQPWAVLDAVVGLGLSTLDDIAIVCADINSRVVDHLRDVGGVPPTLLLLTGIGDHGVVSLAPGYREYFAALGRSIGRVPEAPSEGGTALTVPRGHLLKHLEVSPDASRAVTAERLDVVTERLTGEGFDLIVATNVLPYFDDDELMLAMSNIAGMLKADGVLLHNEARPALHQMTAALGLPAMQSRHAVIASVQGAPPLGDSVWMHTRGTAPRSSAQEAPPRGPR